MAAKGYQKRITLVKLLLGVLLAFWKPATARGEVVMPIPPGGEPLALVWAIDQAKKSFLFRTDQLNDAVIADALRRAARRGVRVLLRITHGTAQSAWLRANSSIKGIRIERARRDHAAIQGASIAVVDKQMIWYGPYSMTTTSLRAPIGGKSVVRNVSSFFSSYHRGRWETMNRPRR